ncbi:MAG: hypothetical protein WCV84_03465 [Patescibacteria group bacterium]
MKLPVSGLQIGLVLLLAIVLVIAWILGAQRVGERMHEEAVRQNQEVRTQVKQ